MCEPTTIAAISLAASVVGTGASIYGMQQQASAARAQASHQQAQLQQQQTVLAQDQARESEAEVLRQQLIGREGRQQRGQIRAAQAGLGQLVDVGSAADITSDLAAEVAFKKLLSQERSDILKRNLTIESQSLQGRIGASQLEAKAASSAANIKSFSTVLTSGSSLARKFKRGDKGGIEFRTV